MIDHGRNPIIALNALANGPGYGGAAAYCGLPFRAGFAEEVGPGECGATAVVAMDYDDRGVRQRDSVVDRFDRRIGPITYLSEIDACKHLWGEAQVAANPGQMVDGDDCPNDGGELEHLRRHIGHSGIGEWHIRGCESDLAVAKLRNAGL